MNEMLSNHTPERKLRHKGPNYTADAVIICPNLLQILLIERSDTGEWALPGGFIDTSDGTSYDAAVREALEETGIAIKDGIPVFRGRVDDPRNSLESWIETEAYCFILPSTIEPTASDDAVAAKWHHLGELPQLYASHMDIVEQAFRYIKDSEVS